MFGGGALAQTADKLTIAFNVNLPAFDPTVGPSSVNPTIQAIYRSIFDQYIGQNADLSLAPGAADQMGLERRQDQGLHGCARRRRLARRLAVHARGRRLVARARRRPQERQSRRFRLGLARQLQDRGQPHHRRRQELRSDALQVDGVPDRLCHAEGLLHEGRRRRLREEADRHRPLHGRRISGQRLPAAEAQRQILGSEARLRDGHLQVRARRDEPRGRDRKRLVRRHARNSL